MTRVPYMHVPTLAQKQAFLRVAYANGHCWDNSLAASLKHCGDNLSWTYVRESDFAGYITFISTEGFEYAQASKTSTPFLCNSPRQFFAYVKIHAK